MSDYNLFLDDIRQPYETGNYIYPVELRKLYRLEKWEVVRNYNEFVKVIQEKGLPKLISFDHDLADVHYNPSTWTEGFVYHEKTGLDCAKWLVERCIEERLTLPEYIVHSANPTGAENIKKYLENYKNEVREDNIS